MSKDNFPEVGEGKVLLKGVLRTAAFLLFSGLSWFASYGSWDWWQAWVLIAIWVVYYVLLFTMGRKVNPGVVLERARTGPHSPNPSWDRKILGSYLVVSIVLNVSAGLDAGRFGWSVVPDWIAGISLAGCVLANLLPYWAILSNPYASGVVHIQEERGHRVISDGPYRYLRHPMYLGGLLYAVSYPLFLGSYWALIPGAVVVGLMVMRTNLEDRFLMENLDGYREYAARVRWRLLPGVW
jgi:protein-S-isoprenylcysteine O-methyltransferase Ste14